MAEVFKNARKVLLGSAGDAIYTVPAATKAIVIGCQVANVGTTSYDLTMYWTDDSNSDAVTNLAQAIPVPDAAAYEPIGGKLVLEAGDALFGFASTANFLEATVSVLEIS
jgi:hypothetical protein